MVLRYLDDQPDKVATIAELARYIETEERTFADEPTTPAEQIEINLHNCHLPKLATRNLVEYDIRSGRIRYDPDETTETLLESIRKSVSISDARKEEQDTDRLLS